VAISSNEGRCTQCHISYGWKSGTDTDTFFNTPENIDCLICHDTTGTYRKHPSADGGGGPASLLVDGEVVPVIEMSELNDVAQNVGAPSRANCGLCHYFAGGDDNVKHGDLSTDLNDATNEQDVHMGGLDYSCQKCHVSQNHKIAGTTAVHSDEGEVACADCHNVADLHSATPLLANHTDTVACQVCHIPTFSRTMATNVSWDWEKAGPGNCTDTELQFDRAPCSEKKGEFVWDMDVTPTYLWFDGQWARKVVNVSDTYTEAGTEEDPVVLAAPTATAETEGAKIYPFKKMVGRQPADPVNQLMLVPHLFGTGPGPDPYWVSFDWGLAVAEGAAYAGQDYSGDYEFVNTVMYLSINHEVAPATEALQCADCHGAASFWEPLGIDNPYDMPGE